MKFQLFLILSIFFIIIQSFNLKILYLILEKLWNSSTVPDYEKKTQRVTSLLTVKAKKKEMCMSIMWKTFLLTNFICSTHSKSIRLSRSRITNTQQWANEYVNDSNLSLYYKYHLYSNSNGVAVMEERNFMKNCF